jgi:hypothetical protein
MNSNAYIQAGASTLFGLLGTYSGAANYTQTDLLDVVPEDLVSYLNLKAYGRTDPTDECLPTHARSNTLKASKKMLSAFMPRQMIPWDDIRRAGIPTRSSQQCDKESNEARSS